MTTKKNRSKNLLLFLILLSALTISAQQFNYTLNRDYSWKIDNYYNTKGVNFQTFSKPYLQSAIEELPDSTVVFPCLFPGLEKHSSQQKLRVKLYPLLNAGAVFQANTTRLNPDFFIGGNLIVNLGKKWSVNTKVLTGAATYPYFMDSVIKNTGVIPGLGYAYRVNDKSTPTLYSYHYYSGYLSFTPNKVFNIQAGQDKNFFGDGYRSLFLSDVAAPYPYLKITTRIWNLTYINLYTIMKDATNPSGLKKDWLNKYGTFHYLGWNATKRIQVGLFETIIWQGSDSVRYRGYDVNYLNPVLFFRPTEYSLGSGDNALVGISMKIKLFKQQQLYGQVLFDEILLKELLKQNGWWANKYGFQIGIKSFDLFKIKHLNFQTEFNYVRPYTYSHGSVQQNYSHLNQPLAHPLGANFVESATFFNYSYKRIFIEAKGVYAVYGADSTGTDYGKNIFIPYTKRIKDYGNETTQGVKTHLYNFSLRAAYILDAKMNLKCELGFAWRMEKTPFYVQGIPLVYIGFKTDLGNLYNDF